MIIFDVDLQEGENLSATHIENEKEKEVQIDFSDANVDVDFIPDLNLTPPSNLERELLHEKIDLNEPYDVEDTREEFEIFDETFDLNEPCDLEDTREEFQIFDEASDLNESCVEHSSNLEIGLVHENIEEVNSGASENEEQEEVNSMTNEPEEAQNEHRHGHSTCFSNDMRREICNVLLQKSIDDKLKYGTLGTLASQFSISIRTIQRIWKSLKTDGDIYHKKRNCGRKRIYNDLARIEEIPLHDRTTLASLACSMKMSKSTCVRLLQSGAIKRHSNAIKPFLKEENKKSRLQFCISMLEEDSIPHDPIFKGMYNIVHIDEKWFYMTKKKENYYLLPNEDEPLRTCKSKNFIGKVMFLAAIARPRFDAEGNELFSGKIGVFPFVTLEPAKRSSVNRVAGTLELKPIPSVNRDIVRSFLIDKVLPAIKAKWPIEDSRSPIFIQQDNARTHINFDDVEFCRSAREDGFDIRLMCQPPNSPDLNILDLGFFSAIQALQYKESVKSIDELVNAVYKSFETFSTVKSNRIFLTLQMCMIEIMKVKGAHKYTIPHMNKEKMENDGNLPTQLKCDGALPRPAVYDAPTESNYQIIIAAATEKLTNNDDQIIASLNGSLQCANSEIKTVDHTKIERLMSIPGR
ncbi:uncharacterized protein LOC126671037 [Mercurialis annua]|uniref:uncharacterized protein LOC126671037 n=1 Tax=Mercurialis annua TaxID=3986 RepID=UPI002160ABBF|nr:uncharacterized protein LOC126671037 [Mercurialis annua]